MDAPKELSLSEIRKYMLNNGGRVTNHALVKHFKRFLTHPDTQNEARKEFKTYVNILATIKNENNQKYLILRKKYYNECPSDDVVQRAILQSGSADSVPNSPGGVSMTSDAASSSPYRQPPPYKPPPEVFSTPLAPLAPLATGVNVHEENVDNYRECVNEFTTAMSRIDAKRLERQTSDNEAQTPTPQSVDEEESKLKELEEKANKEKSVSRANSVEASSNKENIPRFSFSSGSSATSTEGSGEKSSGPDIETENPMSVKEATRKFNRMASEEEAKIISPPSKKKPEKLIEEKELPEVTLAHPKAKEWIVSMAKANYQELAKLANEYPELVKLQDPSTGYTALHWAAKHGNEDVVKLIAGTYKADVNAQTNGGYTPLHIAMQFGRSNIFALLCNTYKANRDLLDWSGNKPLDYSKQQTSVSASTYSKIQAMRQQLINSGYGTWRNQSKEKTNSRKRFGIPTDWLFECSSEENDRSIQQLLGSGQWHWEHDTTTSSPSTRSINSKSPSPAPSPSPSLSSSSSRSRWYDSESAPPTSDDDEKISNNDDEEPTIIIDGSTATGLEGQCTN